MSIGAAYSVYIWTDASGQTWQSTNGTDYTKIPKEPIMSNPDAEAATSFRYRLRQAAKLALEIGDKLLQLSQDASEPNAAQLKELRDIESSLDVTFRYRVRDVGSNNYRDSAGSA